MEATVAGFILGLVGTTWLLFKLIATLEPRK